MIGSVGVIAAHYHVPAMRLTHDELVARFGVEKMTAIAESSGIWERRIAPAGVTGADLAFTAADEMLTHHQIDRSSIDYLIYCTQTPDYLIPTTACILQDRLGLRKSIGAVDLNQGCSQYVYGLQLAHALVSSGHARRILVMTGDADTKIIHPLDRANVPLFGDAGTASIVGPVEAGAGILSFEVGTDGASHGLLIQPSSGARVPRSADTSVEQVDKDGNVRTAEHLHMDGRSIFIFGLSVVPKLIDQLLARTGHQKDDVDVFILHQANKFMIDSILKRAGIPLTKTHYCLRHTGNSGGSTVPIAMSEAWSAGRLRPGSLVALVAFGVGLSWAATLMRWPDQALGPVFAKPQFDA